LSEQDMETKTPQIVLLSPSDLEHPRKQIRINPRREPIEISDFSDDDQYCSKKSVKIGKNPNLQEPIDISESESSWICSSTSDSDIFLLENEENDPEQLEDIFSAVIDDTTTWPTLDHHVIPLVHVMCRHSGCYFTFPNWGNFQNEEESVRAHEKDKEAHLEHIEEQPNYGFCCSLCQELIETKQWPDLNGWLTQKKFQEKTKRKNSRKSGIDTGNILKNETGYTKVVNTMALLSNTFKIFDEAIFGIQTQLRNSLQSVAKIMTQNMEREKILRAY